jgi:hypothetical protein
MYLAVQELAQRTTMVRALALVATSRSPARTPALISSWPGRRKMLSVPGCRLPLEKPVGEIRRVAGAESGRHEAGALDANAALHGRGMAREIHYSGDILNRAQCPGSRRSARTGREILHSGIGRTGRRAAVGRAIR